MQVVVYAGMSPHQLRLYDAVMNDNIRATLRDMNWATHGKESVWCKAMFMGAASFPFCRH